MKKIINILLIGFSVTALTQTAQANNKLFYGSYNKIPTRHTAESSYEKNIIRKHAQTIINVFNESHAALQNSKRSMPLKIEISQLDNPPMDSQILFDQIDEYIMKNDFNNIIGMLAQHVRTTHILLFKIENLPTYLDDTVNTVTESDKPLASMGEKLKLYDDINNYKFNSVYEHFLYKSYKAYDHLEKQYVDNYKNIHKPSEEQKEKAIKNPDYNYLEEQKEKATKNTDYNYLEESFDKVKSINLINKKYKENLLLIKNANKAVISSYKIINSIPDEYKRDIDLRDKIMAFKGALISLNRYAIKLMTKHDTEYANSMEAAGNMLVDGGKYKNEKLKEAVSTDLTGLLYQRTNIYNIFLRFRLSSSRQDSKYILKDGLYKSDGYIKDKSSNTEKNRPIPRKDQPMYAYSAADFDSYLGHLCNPYFLGKYQTHKIKDVSSYKCIRDFIIPKLLYRYNKEYKALFNSEDESFFSKIASFFKEKEEPLSPKEGKKILINTSSDLYNLSIPVYLASTTFKVFFANTLYHSILNSSHIRHEAMLGIIKSAELTGENNIQLNNYEYHNPRNTATMDAKDNDSLYGGLTSALKENNIKNINSARKMVFSAAKTQAVLIRNSLERHFLVKEDERKYEEGRARRIAEINNNSDIPSEEKLEKIAKIKEEPKTIRINPFESKCQLFINMSDLATSSNKNFTELTAKQEQQKNKLGAETEVDFTAKICSDVNRETFQKLSAVIVETRNKITPENKIIGNEDLQEDIIQSYEQLNDFNIKMQNMFFNNFGFNSIELKERHKHTTGDNYKFIDFRDIKE